MIVSSGYNIGAPEVENALLVAPRGRRMRGDRRALPRARAEGEGVRGARAISPSRADELVAELQASPRQQIAPYKYPREIEFVDALPKTATGKLRRSELSGALSMMSVELAICEVSSSAGISSHPPASGRGYTFES